MFHFLYNQNMQTDAGNTALHVAASKGTYEAVYFLLGASCYQGLHIKNDAGLTAFGTAKAGRDFRHPGPAGGPEVLELLGNPDKAEACILDYMDRVLHADAVKVGEKIKKLVDEDGDGNMTEQEWDHYTGHKHHYELDGIETAEQVRAREDAKRESITSKHFR